MEADEAGNDGEAQGHEESGSDGSSVVHDQADTSNISRRPAGPPLILTDVSSCPGVRHAPAAIVGRKSPTLLWNHYTHIGGAKPWPQSSNSGRRAMKDASRAPREAAFCW